MTPNDIQAVLFDYGMVLTQAPDPSAWGRMLLITGMDEPAFHTAYWAKRHAYDRGDLSGQAYWRQIAGSGASDATINQLIEADTDLWTVPNQPMIDWAMHLQRSGVRTGILSNIGDAIQLGILARCEWLSGFHHRTWSHALNIAKPELAIYAHAAEGLATAPQHILFIDDREDNIAAAQAVGMQTLRYTTHADFLEQMQSRGLTWLLDPQPVRA